MNELLRRERLLHGWSFKDVANQISCPDERLVRRWENGAVFPGPMYRQKLCLLFQKNAEELGLVREHSKGSSVEEQQEPEQISPESGVLPIKMKKKEQLDALTSSKTTYNVVQEAVKDVNRQRMLERVKHIWIKGVLEHSLDSQTVIPLELYEDTRLVENPWRVDVQEVDRPARLLACDISIMQVYNASHGELLILGEPGAGKTTLLLSLMQTLLEKAADDDTHPIPVVFHLASWSIKKRPLSLWLIEELMGKYQVPYHISRSWVEQDQLLLLLDGLDEVRTNAYEECIAAINTYREDHGLVSLVVCSRYANYFAQDKRLLLKDAVTIQPLTTQQIDRYLERGGEVLASLHTQFTHEVDLRELIKTPLMLTILQRTYRDRPTGIFSVPNDHVQQDWIFHDYIEQMFQRRSFKQIYTKAQTLKWLSWLARQMKDHHQSVFYVESLQFDSFSDASWLPHLPVLLLGLIMAGFGWLEYGLFFGVNFGFRVGFLQGGIFALCVLLLYVLINGFVFKKIAWLNVNTQVRKYHFQENSQRWSSILKRSSCKFIYGLSFGFPLGLLFGWITGHIYGQSMGIAYGVYTLFTLTVDFLLLGQCPEIIQPVEAFAYSWDNLRKKLIYCIGGGLAGGIVLWLFFVNEFELLYALFLALTFSGGFTCLLAGSVGAISPRSIDERLRLLPNEGIRRSGRNSLALGGCYGGLGGLLFGLIFLLFGHPSTTLVFSIKTLVTYGVIPGISIFQIIALRNGGYAWLQHVTLCLLLWYSGAIPRNYPAFLDYAVERALLRKAGGGYIFIHSSLFEYFAQLKRLPPPVQIPSPLARYREHL